MFRRTSGTIPGVSEMFQNVSRYFMRSQRYLKNLVGVMAGFKRFKSFQDNLRTDPERC